MSAAVKDFETLFETFKDLALAETRSNQLPEHSTVNQLPGELLASVFSEVLRDYINEEAREAADLLPRAPFILAAVCTTWRDLMLGSPVLWTTIIINLDAPSSFDYTSVLELILTRSGTAWLHVSIIEMWRRDFPGDFNRRFYELKVRLVSLGDRIRTLAIHSNIDPFFVVRDEIIFPNLTHFHFYYAHPFLEPSLPIHLWMSPKKLPSLVDVRITAAGMNEHLMQGLCRLSSKAETWNIYVTHVPHALDLLRSATDALRVLAVSMNDPKSVYESVSDTSFRMAPMPHLEELYVDGTSHIRDMTPDEVVHDPVPLFFNSLHSAPYLRVLWIEHESWTPKYLAWNRDAFNGFAQRSDMGRTLAVLIIWTTFMTDEDVIDMIKLLPNIQFFSVASRGSSESSVAASSTMLLDHLTPGHDRPVILPKLEAFRVALRGSTELASRLAAVAQLAETRCRPFGFQKLVSLDIWVDDSLRQMSNPNSSIPDSMDRLHRCRMLSLRLHLKHMPSDAQHYGEYFLDLISLKRSNPLMPGVPL